VSGGPEEQGGAGASADAGAGAGFVVGAVDLYQHAEPDLLPRRGDDIALARDALGAGLAAAVHRHHFSPTAERSRLVAALTGFPLLGAILLNDSVGGLNPTAVELAVEMGAAWIGLPTLSARAQRQRLGRVPTAHRRALTFGPGHLALVDADGRLLDEVQEILRIAAEHGLVVNVGYAGFSECRAVLHAAKAIPLDKVVITNPLTTMGFTPAELDELLGTADLVVEQTCYSLHSSGSYGGGDAAVEAAAALIGHVGYRRIVLSSDGGMQGAPPPAELLAWGCERLLAAGLAEGQLRHMTSTLPSELVAATLRR
jgi:hypothetical protein